jgi:hypothetical protein
MTKMTSFKYVDRIKEAIGKATTLDRIDYIKEKIETSPEMPNRRTKIGREIRDKLLALSNNKAQDLISSGAEPF